VTRADARASRVRDSSGIFGAHVAGDVIAPLAPIQAGSAEDAAAAGRRHKYAAEAGEKALAGHRKLTTLLA